MESSACMLCCCRLLLTQDSQDCFVLIMDVVRQVVKAAHDHIDSKRASGTGKRNLLCYKLSRNSTVPLFPIARYHLSCDNCLKTNMEDNHYWSGLCCV